MTPEPQAVSAPLPQPTPVNPPLPATPAAEPEAEGRRRFGRKRKANNDYVDWVSGLGND